MAWIRLQLPDDLHRKIKAQAALAGMTLRGYLIKMLQELADRKDKQ
jgi:hypothetical protein